MLLRSVEYARPSTVEDAIRLLREHSNARALAGGQTLVNVMKARAAAPDVLVDLNRLQDLRTVGVTPEGGLELGAMATYSELMRSPEVHATRPIVADVASQIADVQVRNRGTIGGNVCSADPTNHFLPVMVALGATMTVASVDGERRVPAEEFFLGVYFTAAGPGELLTRITIPPARGGDGFASVSLGADGTCIVNAAATLDEGAARIAIGCVSATPVRATEMESALAGGEPTDEAIREAARGLGGSLDPPSDVHASADYRRHLAEVCAVRAVRQAAGRS